MAPRIADWTKVQYTDDGRSSINRSTRNDYEIARFHRAMQKGVVTWTPLLPASASLHRPVKLTPQVVQVTSPATVAAGVV